MSRLYFVDAMPYCFAQSIDDVLTWWAVYSAFPFRVNPKLELGTGTTPHVLIFLQVNCVVLRVAFRLALNYVNHFLYLY